MNERLHPLALGEVLDRTAQMYRAQFLRFLGIAAFPTGVLLVFVALTAGFSSLIVHAKDAGTSGNTLGIAIFAYLGVLGVVGLPVFGGMMALSWAALTDATAATFLGGTFTIRGAYGRVWGRRWRVLWLLTMETFFLGVIPVSAVVAVTAPANKAGLGALGAWGTVVMFVPIAALAGGALWLLLRVCLGFAACVEEQVSAWQALKRSTVLSKGTKGRLFLVFLLAYALEILLTMWFFFLVVFLVQFVPGLQGAKNEGAASAVIGFAFYGLWFLVQVLTRPVYGIGLTLIYFDQKIRKEGFDVEWMMRHAGMAGIPAAFEGPAAPTEASPWLVLPD
ncbi:MAG TPA: hypothetical protein VMV57_11230 [Terracidiphilus sp.]|nr:hypothetical protein [Terracidiphilus sp.]